MHFLAGFGEPSSRRKTLALKRLGYGDYLLRTHPLLKRKGKLKKTHDKTMKVQLYEIKLPGLGREYGSGKCVSCSSTGKSYLGLYHTNVTKAKNALSTVTCHVFCFCFFF